MWNLQCVDQIISSANRLSIPQYHRLCVSACNIHNNYKGLQTHELCLAYPLHFHFDQITNTQLLNNNKKQFEPISKIRRKKKIYDVINSPTTAAPMAMVTGSTLTTTLIKNILNTNRCTTKLKCIIFCRYSNT